jgi:hypothetical protein
MQPPRLDVADKLILSPMYHTQYRREYEVSDHQLHFLVNESSEEESSGRDLFSFGEKLNGRIQHSPFYWKGFGTLRYASSEIVFEPDEISLQALQPIPAHKVLRENVQHQMLVGDQQMSSQQITDVLNQVETKRSWVTIAGWIVLALAVTAILLYLYSKNFQTSSTGLRTRW